MAEIFDDIEILDVGEEITSINKWQVSDDVKKKIHDGIVISSKLVSLDNTSAVNYLINVYNPVYENELFNMRDSIVKIQKISAIIGEKPEFATYLQYMKSLAALQGGVKTYEYINNGVSNKEKTISESDVIANRLSRDFNDVSKYLDGSTIESISNIYKKSPNSIYEKIIVVVDKLKAIASYNVFNNGWSLEMVNDFINRQIFNICLEYRKSKVFGLSQELESEYTFAINNMDLSENEKKVLDELISKIETEELKKNIIKEVSSLTFSSIRKRD